MRFLFVRRRCWVLLASNAGQAARQIAEAEGCTDQAVRNVGPPSISSISRRKALERRPSRVHTKQVAFSGKRAEQLCSLLRQPPRAYGRDADIWTLELATEVSFAQGITRR